MSILDRCPPGSVIDYELLLCAAMKGTRKPKTLLLAPAPREEIKTEPLATAAIRKNNRDGLGVAEVLLAALGPAAVTEPAS